MQYIYYNIIIIIIILWSDWYIFNFDSNIDIVILAPFYNRH